MNSAKRSQPRNANTYLLGFNFTYPSINSIIDSPICDTMYQTSTVGIPKEPKLSDYLRVRLGKGRVRGKAKAKRATFLKER